MKKAKAKKIIVISLVVIVAIPLLCAFGLFLYSLKLDLSLRNTLRYFIENDIVAKQTFVSIDDTCSVEAPSVWSVYSGNRTNEILFLTDRGYEYLVLIPHIKKDVIHTSLDKVTEIILESIKKDVQSPRISTPKTIEIDNNKASLIFVDGTVNNEQLAYTHYILDTEDALYHFIFTTNPENKEYADKIFRKMVESFELLPKK